MAETTEFIGGMEKIIAFIKSQGERVKNLEEENEELKEQNDKLKQQNKEQQEEIWFSTLLTGEVVESVCEDMPKMTAEIAEKIAKDHRESVSLYLYDKMKECVAEDIDFSDYIPDSDEEEEEQK